MIIYWHKYSWSICLASIPNHSCVCNTSHTFSGREDGFRRDFPRIYLVTYFITKTIPVTGLLQVAQIMTHVHVYFVDTVLLANFKFFLLLLGHIRSCAKRLLPYGANVFCFLSSFTPPSLSHHGSVWLQPVISLLLIN
jgi:hypothetical protein